MEETGGRPKRARHALPLNEEDLAMAMGAEGGHDEFVRERASVSYVKIFLALALAAPVAVFLALVVIDLYPAFAKIAGLRAGEAIVIPMEAAKTEPEKKGEDKLVRLVESMEKANRDLAAAVGKQTGAVLKLAEKKPDVIKVEAPQVNAKAPQQAQDEGPRIIVVRVPSKDKFDLAYEKRKILELSGVDIDDPVTASKPFDDMKSRDALKEVIRSLDAIIAASRDHEEVGDFLRNNALEAKKLAQKSLSKLK